MSDPTDLVHRARQAHQGDSHDAEHDVLGECIAEIERLDRISLGMGVRYAEALDAGTAAQRATMTDNQLIELWLAAFASGTKSAYAAIGADDAQANELVDLLLATMRDDPAVIDSIRTVVHHHRDDRFPDTPPPDLHIDLNHWKSA